MAASWWRGVRRSHLLGTPTLTTFGSHVTVFSLFPSLPGVKWVDVCGLSGAKTWQSLGNAPWTTRAGIAFTQFDGKMIVAGGCYGESGPSGQGRKFLNDVWASTDGSQWEQITANASWSARSGARLVVFGGKLFLVAGEVGFTPDTQASRPPCAAVDSPHKSARKPWSFGYIR